MTAGGELTEGQERLPWGTPIGRAYSLSLRERWHALRDGEGDKLQFSDILQNEAFALQQK